MMIRAYQYDDLDDMWWSEHVMVVASNVLLVEPASVPVDGPLKGMQTCCLIMARGVSAYVKGDLDTVCGMLADARGE